MPDLLDDLRLLGEVDRRPSDDARQHGLRRLQHEIDRERGGAGERRRPYARPRVIAGAAAALALATAAIAALVPSAGPGGPGILQRAAAAVTADRPEIIVADIHAQPLDGDRVVGSYGTKRIWARQVPGRGTREFRSLQLTDADASRARAADESVSYPSATADPVKTLPFTTEEYSAAEDRIVVSPGVQSNIGPELFQARALLTRARAGEKVTVTETTLDGRPTYMLGWTEDTSRAPNQVTVELTLWVDRETYAPLQFTDHSFGTDAQGRPLDHTYKATISGFHRLPDTVANRQLLRMRPHPDARRVSPDADQQP